MYEPKKDDDPSKNNMISVEEFYNKYGAELALELVAGKKGMKKRSIKVPEVHRAGLSLTGYLKNFSQKRILILGKVEVEYLKTLSAQTRRERLAGILKKQMPAVVLSRRFRPMKELLDICNERALPLFRTGQSTMNVINQMSVILTDEFAPIASRHGTFVEVFDIGVLLEGDSSIGKSETALGLIERGHRLITDDIVRIKRTKDSTLEGKGVELTRHHMEIRGIGIINVANLYGAFCVRNKKRIDLIVKLEAWDSHTFYDRVGSDEKTCEILGLNVPYSILPVKPGRDVVLLIEAIALNYRLKKMGYHSAKDFKARLSKKIAANQAKVVPL